MNINIVITGNKKILWLLLVACVSITLVLTNPSKEQYSNWMTEKIIKIAVSEDAKENGEEGNGEVRTMVKGLAALFAPSVIRSHTETTNLVICTVFSTGTNDQKRMTLGVLGTFIPFFKMSPNEPLAENPEREKSPRYALDVPKLQGYVNDYAGMMSPQTRDELENELRSFEASDSTQIVVLTIPSLEGESIEDFGIRVGEAWKIGQQNRDNGALFIVAKQERKIRIEAGRGLELKLTSLMAGKIIDLVVTPRFKKGDFDEGFRAGISAMIDATRGEFKTEDRHVPRTPNREESM